MDHFLIIFLLLGFFIFLFSLFALSREDFLLLRKNISLDELFSFTFLIFLISLFCSRLTFVVENFKLNYLHPLIFFIFPYFPGLSLSGGIISGVLFFYFVLKRKKYPIERIFDIFSISFIIAFSIQLLLLFLVNLIFRHFTFLIFSFIFLLILIPIFIWIFENNKLKDGSVGYLAIGSSILAFMIGYFIQNIKLSIINSKIEIILSLLIFIFSIGGFIKQEYLSKKRK